MKQHIPVDPLVKFALKPPILPGPQHLNQTHIKPATHHKNIPHWLLQAPREASSSILSAAGSSLTSLGSSVSKSSPRLHSCAARDTRLVPTLLMAICDTSRPTVPTNACLVCSRKTDISSSSYRPTRPRPALSANMTSNAPSSPKLDRYVVIHVATTCDEHGVYVTKDSAEVIELGWILLDSKSCEEVSWPLTGKDCNGC